MEPVGTVGVGDGVPVYTGETCITHGRSKLRITETPREGSGLVTLSRPVCELCCLEVVQGMRYETRVYYLSRLVDTIGSSATCSLAERADGPASLTLGERVLAYIQITAELNGTSFADAFVDLLERGIAKQDAAPS